MQFICLNRFLYQCYPSEITSNATHKDAGITRFIAREMLDLPVEIKLFFANWNCIVPVWNLQTDTNFWTCAVEIIHQGTE